MHHDAEAGSSGGDSFRKLIAETRARDQSRRQGTPAAKPSASHSQGHSPDHLTSDSSRPGSPAAASHSAGDRAIDVAGAAPSAACSGGNSRPSLQDPPSRMPQGRGSHPGAAAKGTSRLAQMSAASAALRGDDAEQTQPHSHENSHPPAGVEVKGERHHAQPPPRRGPVPASAGLASADAAGKACKPHPAQPQHAHLPSTHEIATTASSSSQPLDGNEDCESEGRPGSDAQAWRHGWPPHDSGDGFTGVSGIHDDGSHGSEDLEDPPLSQIRWDAPSRQDLSSAVPNTRATADAVALKADPAAGLSRKQQGHGHEPMAMEDEGHSNKHSHRHGSAAHSAGVGDEVQLAESLSRLGEASSQHDEDLKDPPLSQIRWDECAQPREAVGSKSGSRRMAGPQSHAGHPDRPPDPPAPARKQQQPQEEHFGISSDDDDHVIDIVEDSQEEQDPHSLAELPLRRLQQAGMH